MKAQRITVKLVNQKHGMLPDETQGRDLLLMRIVKGPNGYKTEGQLVHNFPASPRLSVAGWTHYIVLPGYLLP